MQQQLIPLGMIWCSLAKTSSHPNAVGAADVSQADRITMQPASCMSLCRIAIPQIHYLGLSAAKTAVADPRNFQTQCVRPSNYSA
jgi:hypothetical protein